MVYYAVIDTNVLVSALLTHHEDASPLQIVRRVFQGEIIALYHEEILREYSEVLRRPKFGFSESMVTVLIEAIEKYGISVERLAVQEELPDPKDRVFYEVTMARRGDGTYLVTGNKKHFPTAPFIVTPTEMLQIMDEK